MTISADDLDNVTRVDDLPVLRQPAVDAHKGSFGRVLVVAGSRRMSGAASLAGLGALRGGAGLVFLAVPDSIVSIVARAEPSYQVIGLAQTDDGCLAAGALDPLSDLIHDCSAIALGPGLGQTAGVRAVVLELLASVSKPVVVDADALNVLAAERVAQRQPILGPAPSSPHERLLTPHPGEFGRLTGLTIEQIQKQRAGLAASFARQFGVTLLLKGRATVVSDGCQLFVNSTGNNGMATGGSGDVLTGLLAALLAQGWSAFDAARIGAHVHGLAGDLAVEELSKPGLIASDLPRYLAVAWKTLHRRQ
jgi:NAD(P)H-hydrate epimerase